MGIEEKIEKSLRDTAFMASRLLMERSVMDAAQSRPWIAMRESSMGQVLGAVAVFINSKTKRTDSNKR